MKKAIFLFTLILGVSAINVQAQVMFDNAQVSYGEDAISSGFDVVLSFSNGKNKVYGFQSNNERANIRFGRKFGNFTIMATPGVFGKVPWIGPMVLYNNKGWNVVSWGGYGAAKEKEFINPGTRPTFFFFYNGIDYTIGNEKWKYHKFGYSHMWYLDNPLNHFIYYGIDFPLNGIVNEKSFLTAGKFTAMTTYNYQEEKLMFVIGYVHEFR